MMRKKVGLMMVLNLERGGKMSLKIGSVLIVEWVKKTSRWSK